MSTPTKFKRTRYLWSALGQCAEVRQEILEKGDYSDLNDLVARCDFAGYDRVIVDHNLRRMGSERNQLKRIPNLIVFEFDFCQNYLPASNVRGKLEAILKTLNAHRIIVSSAWIKDDLQAKGFDAEYSPKGYDATLIHDLGQPRDIELGFIGRLKHRAYRPRKALLDRLRRDRLEVRVLQTEENDEYNRALNRIHIFVSPDLDYRELMIKNFEALAAGCALVAARPTPEEVERLGLVDFENVVLYDSYEQLLEKIKLLRDAPDQVRRIARAGRELAVARHRWEARAEPLFQKLQAAPRRPPPLNWKDRWKLLGF